MTVELPLTGGCGCGAVRFEIDAPLVSASYCHCTRCQRRTGTAASANARLAPGSFRIVAGEEHVRAWAPEGGFEKAFCGLCGSALFSRDPASGRRAGVRLGADRRRPGSPPAVAPVRRLRGRVGANPGRRAPALSGTADVVERRPAEPHRSSAARRRRWSARLHRLRAEAHVANRSNASPSSASATSATESVARLIGARPPGGRSRHRPRARGPVRPTPSPVRRPDRRRRCRRSSRRGGRPCRRPRGHRCRARHLPGP